MVAEVEISYMVQWPRVVEDARNRNGPVTGATWLLIIKLTTLNH